MVPSRGLISVASEMYLPAIVVSKVTELLYLRGFGTLSHRPGMRID